MNRMKDGGEEKVTVSFFKDRAKRLWLAVLFLSPVLAIGAAVGFVFVPNVTARIVLAVAVICFGGVFFVCLFTAKMRTSKWTADENGVSYFAFGRKLTALGWAEMKEVGYLKIINPRSNVTQYCLYWTTEELMSCCRDFIKGGVMQQKTKCLGSYNRRKGSIILYQLDVNALSSDPLLLFTGRRYIHPFKNPKVLEMAKQEAEEQNEETA